MTNGTMENSTQILHFLLYLISVLHVNSQRDVSKMFSNEFSDRGQQNTHNYLLEQSTVKLVHW